MIDNVLENEGATLKEKQEGVVPVYYRVLIYLSFCSDRAVTSIPFAGIGGVAGSRKKNVQQSF